MTMKRNLTGLIRPNKYPIKEVLDEQELKVAN